MQIAVSRRIISSCIELLTTLYLLRSEIKLAPFACFFFIFNLLGHPNTSCTNKFILRLSFVGKNLFDLIYLRKTVNTFKKKYHLLFL